MNLFSSKDSDWCRIGDGFDELVTPKSCDTKRKKSSRTARKLILPTYDEDLSLVDISSQSDDENHGFASNTKKRCTLSKSDIQSDARCTNDDESSLNIISNSSDSNLSMSNKFLSNYSGTINSSFNLNNGKSIASTGYLSSVKLRTSDKYCNDHVIISQFTPSKCNESVAESSDDSDVDLVTPDGINEGVVDRICSIDSVSDKISIFSSTQSSMGSQRRKSLKASELIKSVTCDVKVEDNIDPVVGDSAKKCKKKYKRDGFAIQLDQLTLREKFRRSVWQRRIKSDITSQKSDAIDVHIYDLETSSMAVIAKCFVTNANVDSSKIMATPDDTPFNDGLSQTDEADFTNKQTVIFSTDCTDFSSLTKGSTVTVFPPWQKIMTGECFTLLAEYYVVTGNRLCRNIPDTLPIRWTWSCPCILDNNIRPEHCPAHSSGPTLLYAALSTPAMENIYRKKVLVASSPRLMNSRTTGNESISDYLENHTTGGDGVGSYISITLTLRRTFVYKDLLHSSELKRSFLATDTRGTFCLVHFNPNIVTEGKCLIEKEAKNLILKLHNFAIQRRLFRERNVALFTVLERIWNVHLSKKILVSDTSQEDLPPACPMFCYEIGAVSAQSSIVIEDVKIAVCKNSYISHDGNHNTLQLSHVTSQLRTSMNQRQDLECEILCKTSSFIYITDSELLEDTSAISYMKISLSPKVHFKHRPCGIFTIYDVILDNGYLLMDEYSSIYRCDSGACVSSSALHLHHLSQNSNKNDLVLVTGRILGVDEDTASMWDVCSFCQSDKLFDVTEPGEVYCDTCRANRATTSLYQMTIFIRCDDFLHWQITIQLQQQTILELLPKNCSSEEYDSSCVINRRVGPLISVVDKIDSSNKEIMLSEILVGR